MSEEGGRIDLGVSGLRVERCGLVGSQFELGFQPEEERGWTTIRIASRFRIRNAEGESWFLIEEDRGEAHRAVALFWRTVESAFA